jgi:hypothetical protein
MRAPFPAPYVETTAGADAGLFSKGGEMKTILIGALTVAAAGAHATTLFVFNFNQSDGSFVDLTPSHVMAGTNPSLITNFEPQNITHFAGTTVNAQMGDPAGRALALQGGVNTINNGRSLTLLFNGSGWMDFNLSYATQRTSTGFNSQTLSYSTDGVNFVNVGSFTEIPSAFATRSWDLSSIGDLNDEQGIWLRLTFTGATAELGNNRIDNLVVTANPVPEPATMAALAIGLGAVAARRRRKSS